MVYSIYCSNGLFILRCICHFPFILTLQRIFRRMQVIILPTPENVKHNTTGQRGPIFNCSLKLWLTVDSGTPCHPAQSSTVHCQFELLGTVENTIFAGRWCGVFPNLLSQWSIQSTVTMIYLIYFHRGLLNLLSPWSIQSTVTMVYSI